MAQKLSIEDVADKVDWEGGVISAIEWGVSSDDIDNQTLAALWKTVEDVYPTIEAIYEILKHA